jgi:hypothetical protein
VFLPFDLDLFAFFFLTLIFLSYRFWIGLPILIIFYSALLSYFGFNPISNSYQWLSENYVKAILYVFTYVAIGVLWSIFMWYVKVKKWIGEVKVKKANYDNLAVKKDLNFKAYYSRVSYDTLDSMKVSNYKSEIIFWISFWWFSFIETFFGEWLKNFFNGIYTLFSSLYGAILSNELKKIGIDNKSVDIDKEVG